MRLREAGLWKGNLKRTSPGYEYEGFCDNSIELWSYVQARECFSGAVNNFAEIKSFHLEAMKQDSGEKIPLLAGI